MSSESVPVAISPVRIYVLWHPKLRVPRPDPARPQANAPEISPVPTPPKTVTGLEVARRIYRWFRLDSMEGIPVFFRSEPDPEQLRESGSNVPSPPPDIPCDNEINYVVPLLDGEMVTNPTWRNYLTRLAAGALWQEDFKDLDRVLASMVAPRHAAGQWLNARLRTTTRDALAAWNGRGPAPAALRQAWVADLDALFRTPDGLRDLPGAAIRPVRKSVKPAGRDASAQDRDGAGPERDVIHAHRERWEKVFPGTLRPASERARTVLVPVALDASAYQAPREVRALNFIRYDPSQDPAASMEPLLARLTEIFGRDLREQRHAEAAGGAGNESRAPTKLKIFLSHAKADGTGEAIALKNHIQNHTQCEAFFDETEIPSGADFATVLNQAIEQDSAGMIVVQGDHYAHRPWCRREIQEFLRPRAGKTGDGPPLYFVPPVVVAQTARGNDPTRTIPELGFAPCLRWENRDPARAGTVVTLLLREVLFSLFYRRLAERLRRTTTEAGTVLLNRTPDPVMVSRILAAKRRSPTPRPRMVLHPGYGLSRLEDKSLRESYGSLEFRTFAEAVAHRPPSIPGLREELPGKPRPVVLVSVGNSSDALAYGVSDEHTRELLTRLLRPLFREGLSVLYGGSFRGAGEMPDGIPERLNFTTLFLDLLQSERLAAPNGRERNRIFNLCAWPNDRDLTREVRARWIDVSCFIEVTRRDAGIPEELWQDPLPGGALTPRYYVQQARCMSAMRRLANAPSIPCVLPDRDHPGAEPERITIEAAAQILIGGKTTGFHGIMPGVFEEFLHAVRAKRPIFVIGAAGGAAGILARWLLDPPRKRPRESSPEFHGTDPAFTALRREMERVGPAEAGEATPDRELDALWQQFEEFGKNPKLAEFLRNGLSEDENRKLLASRSYGQICELVWKGLAAVFRERASRGSRKRPARPSTKSRASTAAGPRRVRR